MVMLTIDRSIVTVPDNAASPRSYPIELRESIHSTIATRGRKLDDARDTRDRCWWMPQIGSEQGYDTASKDVH
jgi:hypothetical protein